MHIQAVRGFTLFLVLVCCNLAYAQSVMVGPDRKFEKGVISVPYGFYNKNFGVAGAYAYAVTGWPQKQSALIATAMAGSKGSVMGFLMGRDLQMPYSRRLFLDAVVNAGYFQDGFNLKNKLTRREREILKLIVQAKNNKEIGKELFISDQTVGVHRKNIMRKLGVRNSISLIRFAMDNNLV